VEQKPADIPSGAALIEALAHTRLRDCYQCGKCTAGCPMSLGMDIKPNQLLRHLQMGQVEPALLAESIWLCVSCQTCTARCPKSVDCAAILDGLRQVALESGQISGRQQRTIVFQKAFLDNIRRNGRLNELELIAEFKARAFFKDGRVPFLFKDAPLAPRLARRRKLHLIGEKARDRKVVGRIFSRCLNS